MSEFHRVHPLTGEEFDYNHVCSTCANWVERKLVCTVAGVGFDVGTAPATFSACTLHVPSGREFVSKGRRKQRRSD